MPGKRFTHASRCPSQRAAAIYTFGALLAILAGVPTSSANSASIGNLIAPIRGIVRAVDQATISTEAALVVEELPFREGQRFSKGDMLAKFDCRTLAAEIAAADAAHREAIVTLESYLKLNEHKAAGKNDVEIARTREQKALAETDVLKPRLDECSFRAPFDGRIVELALRVYERTAPQRPYMTILNDAELEIETIVPSYLLSRIQTGSPFSFAIDELEGTRIDAVVSTLGAAVDPVSKTVKLIGKISQPVPGLLAGMSGTVSFAETPTR